MMMIMIKFLVLTLVVISPICADKDLMIRECRNAPVPTTCMQCLESDPTSLHADPVGIAGIVIHCLDSQLHTLANNITKLLSEIQKGDAIKTALVACKKDLTKALTKLPDAKNGLKNGDYDKADQSVKLALGFPMRCRKNLKRAKFDEYPQVYSQIMIYAQLSDAAMRIIERF